MSYVMAKDTSAGSQPAPLKIIRKIQTRLYAWIGSPAFFYIILGIFLFQALWIALSARYPQAFDEQYHFGLIQLHATQWLPFFPVHPDNAEIFGPVSRDPSYMFHYLMSLPLRLLTYLSASQWVQIIVLRLIDVGLFGAGLFVYRSLLKELGIGRRLRHAVLFFFVLTPVVIQLASQINYDNLLFLLTGLLFLQTIRFIRVVRSEQRVDVTKLLAIGFYGLLSAIVTYASLPIIAGAFILAGWFAAREIYVQRSSAIFKFPRAGIFTVWAILVLVMGALAVERYGINLVRYHTPVPDCAAVLTVEQCQSYAPWARDHMFAQTYPKPTREGIIVYPFVWIHRMIFESMFVISSRFDYDGATVVYIPAPPLTVANYTSWVIVIVGGMLALWQVRRLWQLTYLRLLLFVVLFYAAVLFLKNFSMYLHTGEAVAIHGRYFVAIYPLLYLVPALGFVWLFRRIGRPALQTLLGVLTLVCFLHGAGLIAWIYRSDPSWYWSSSPDSTVYKINRPVQAVVHHTIIP